MKMSPRRSQGVFQADVSVVERDTAVESLIEMDFGASKAEALSLLGDLEALAFPLHNVVVADDALMNKAADAVQIFRGGAPSGLHFTGPTGEAAVEVGKEVTQHGVGGVQIASLSQAQLAAQTILEDAPEAFDAAFGLGTAGGDESDAELFEGASELSGLTFSSEFFFSRPEVVIADEDAAVIAVEGERDTAGTQELAEQGEIAGSGFGGEELSGQDFSRGIVLHAERGQSRAATLEPIVGRAVELHHFAFVSGSQTALAMNGSATLSGRSETGLPQETAESFATEGEALDLAKFFAEVVIVEAGISGTGQANDGLAYPVGQAAGAGPAAVGMRQSRLPLLPQTFLETFNLTDAEREQCGGSGARHVSLSAARNYAHSLQFLLTQRECPSSHGVTFSRCR